MCVSLTVGIVIEIWFYKPTVFLELITTATTFMTFDIKLVDDFIFVVPVNIQHKYFVKNI